MEETNNEKENFCYGSYRGNEHIGIRSNGKR